MNVVKRLLGYLKPLWKRFAVALLAMSVVAGLTTGVLWIVKFLIDNALAAQDLQTLNNGVLLLLIALCLKSFLWYSHTYLSAYISQSICRHVRDEAYRHLYSLSMGFFNEKASGGILARLTNDITMMQAALISGPTVLIRDGLTIMGLIGFLFYIHWKFACITFLILPITGVVLTSLGRKSRKAGREGQARMGEMYTTIHEALAAMPIVKVFQQEKREIDDFTRGNRSYFDVIMKLARVEARSSPIMEAIGGVVLAFMLMVGGRDVIAGHWSLGSFVTFVGAAISLYTPIKKFASVNVQVQQGLAAAERVFELLDQKGTVVDAPDAIHAPTISEGLTFEHVSFSYPNGTEVLNDFSLTIKKGDIVALVGASGSGKSTMAQLLLRFYDPTRGRVLLDRRDVKTISLASLRSQIAIVTQDTHLFNDTVEANIAYGRPSATPEQIQNAAKAAFAHDFISRLPDGYKTIIGERGARLSGGEKQRISIARALLKDPAILILDEATSALDAASEKAVQVALDRLLEGRTVLMIAHRLATIRKADRIVVLEKGKISEMGTHEELLARQGAYHQLHHLQSLV